MNKIIFGIQVILLVIQIGLLANIMWSEDPIVAKVSVLPASPADIQPYDIACNSNKVTKAKSRIGGYTYTAELRNPEGTLWYFLRWSDALPDVIVVQNQDGLVYPESDVKTINCLRTKAVEVTNDPF